MVAVTDMSVNEVNWDGASHVYYCIPFSAWGYGVGEFRGIHARNTRQNTGTGIRDRETRPEYGTGTAFILPIILVDVSRGLYIL